MKIKELSRKSHVNAETIRMYRRLGLLNPVQNPENHYYEYSRADLMSLLFIRKLRGSNLSLSAISYTYGHSDISDLLGRYQEELRQVDLEIEKLQRRRAILRLTLDHLELYRDNSGISVIKAGDDRYDCYTAENGNSSAMDCWVRNIELFTQTVLIPKEILTASVLPERIPVRTGIGTYGQLLLQYQLPMPEDVVVCPKGTYVCADITLDHPDYVEREQLLPLLQYISMHHYHIESDTTAFLFRAEQREDHIRFTFRMRVKVS